MSSNPEVIEADNVIEIYPVAQQVPPLSDAEVLLLRQFMQEFALIRGTCPMAIRHLAMRG